MMPSRTPAAGVVQTRQAHALQDFIEHGDTGNDDFRAAGADADDVTASGEIAGGHFLEQVPNLASGGGHAIGFIAA